MKNKNNNPHLINVLRNIFVERANEWITIKELTNLINNRVGREVVNCDDVRMGLIPELRDDTDTKLRLGSITSSNQGIKLTTDLNERSEALDKWIEIETNRIKGIGRKLKEARQEKRRLDNLINYNPDWEEQGRKNMEVKLSRRNLTPTELLWEQHFGANTLYEDKAQELYIESLENYYDDEWPTDTDDNYYELKVQMWNDLEDKQEWIDKVKEKEND